MTRNRGGAHAGLGGSVTAANVAWIRDADHLPDCSPEAPGACPTGQRGDGRYSVWASTALQHGNVSPIADWCRAGPLEYVQQTPHNPHWVSWPSECIATWRAPVRPRTPRQARPIPFGDLDLPGRSQFVGVLQQR
jgi:hypothetical protein